MPHKDEMELRDFLGVLRRRRMALALGIAAVVALTAAVATLMPRSYRATATIQIERQVVPDEWLASPALGSVGERLHAVSQRVKSEENLRRIAERYPVFPPGWQQEPGWLDAMRKAITIEKVDLEVTDPRRGRMTVMTVAFDVSFEGRTPEIAQQVTQELAALYLQDNSRRRSQTAAVVDFLSSEADRLRGQVGRLEQQLSQFKRKHLEALPELAAVNRSLYDRTLSDVEQTQEAVRVLEQRRIALRTRLASTPRDLGVYAEDGSRVMSTRQRLRMLRTQYAQAKALYSSDHPDVLRLEGEISALESSLRTERPVDSEPGNPAYVALQGELASVNADLETHRAQLEQLQKAVKNYEERLSAAPAVEKEYQALVRERDSVSARYREVSDRLLEAQMTLHLESGQVGDHMYLIRPAELPRKATNPTPLAVVAFGLVLSLGSGVGAAAFSEYWDRSVRDPQDIQAVLGQLPLVVMPYVENRRERLRRKRRQWAVTAVLLAAVVAVALWQTGVVEVPVLDGETTQDLFQVVD